MSDQVSTGCGLTGLEIKPGDRAWLVLLDADYCAGDGPAKFWAQLTPPVAGIYDGYGGLVVDTSDAEAEERAALFFAIAGFRRPIDDTVNRRVHKSDQEMWLACDAAFKFIPEIPHQNTELGTVGGSTEADVKVFLEEAKDHLVVADGEGDAYELNQAWERVLEVDAAEGQPSYANYTGSYTEQARIGLLTSAYTDSRVIHQALLETRQRLVPTLGGLDSEGHHAVAALARFTRRKAIAASLTVAE